MIVWWLTAVWSSVQEFSLSNPFLQYVAPTYTVLFAFVYFDHARPCGSHPGTPSTGFHTSPSPSHPRQPFKPHMTRDHICCAFFYPIYVVLLRRCSRYPVPSFPSLPSCSYLFALLNFLVIFALKRPSSPNQTIVSVSLGSF